MTKETLPIKDAYFFLEKKELGEKIKIIKELRSDNRATSIRRGFFITIAEENNILDEFIEKYWQFGKSNAGKTRINYYKRLYNDRINS